MRGKLVINNKSFTVNAKGKTITLPVENDGVCEILMDVEPGKVGSLSLTFSNENGEKSVMTYAPNYETLSFDRRVSGIVDFSQDFPAVTTAPTFNAGQTLPLRIFIDRSSMEVFANDGKCVMTNLVFPTTPYNKLTINTDGGNAKVKNVKVYSINIEE